MITNTGRSAGWLAPLSWSRNTLALATLSAVFCFQVSIAVAQAPRYRSPLEPSTPQLGLPTPPAPVTPQATVVAYPIVRVNDQIIDNADYERTAKQMMSEAQQSNLAPAEMQQREKDLLRDMIDQQLLISRGKDLDINPDSELVRRLDEIRKQNHVDAIEQKDCGAGPCNSLEKAVRDQGLSYEDWKASIRNSIITQQVVRDEVARGIRLTPKDEQAYYEAHKQQFVAPEHVRLSEILIPTPDNASDSQVQQAKAKADEVAAKLKDGAAFDALAKQYSGGPNAATGGDLGEFKRGDLGKVLEDQTFPLQVGQFTDPIRTRQGYVILKVAEHTPEGVQPLSAVDDQVQQAMYEEAIQPALRTYLTKLRENAYIDIAAGYVDTGASPKQTKPLFQGATPLPVKKKEKARLDQQRARATLAAAGKPTSTLMANGKSKKIRREKIRYGQAPQNALPDSPEVTLSSGADTGAGAASASQPAPGEAIAPTDSSNTVAANADITANPQPQQRKTRYTERQATEEQAKAEKKVKKAKEKIAAVAAAPTPEENLDEKTQSAPLGLNGDTTSKKKTAVKGAPRERIQEKAPAPPAPRPEATPIPPKSVRDNGEPVVAPPPSTPPSSVTPPGTTGASSDAAPATPQQ